MSQEGLGTQEMVSGLHVLPEGICVGQCKDHPSHLPVNFQEHILLQPITR